MKILIIEDDALMGAGLQSALNNAGFDADWVADGQAALDLLGHTFYRAAVLDITLPSLDGMEVLKQLRASGSKLPVLMLTARDTTRDKVLCFEAGADDFLVKTTDIEELIARLQALIRRAGFVGRLQVGALMLDADQQQVTLNEEALNLSNREFKLLRVLMESAGQVIARGKLEQLVFGSSHNNDSNVLEVHIHHLRQKIGEHSIKTVRGVGYTLLRP
ncbi:response regulator transcription factor [Rhodoferax sp.]|uniref:response regulator transcription factor n=1 Tax=Rhodoferax sp. TaxID=50421 RepID=UPI001A077EB4|nr:response regulator transcription factor [Rhodoferax sp.]MBE0472750.1 response regulator transcription factor [Rhodoferax sp.]